MVQPVVKRKADVIDNETVPDKKQKGTCNTVIIQKSQTPDKIAVVILKF